MDWEDAWAGLAYGICIAAVIGLLMYSFSTKQHNGYYLYHSEGCYRVKINWENAPDETAYRTYDKKEAIEIFERLQKAR